MSVPNLEHYRFEVALSFAGDGKRTQVRAVAELLRHKLGDGRVFFDEWFEAELAGHDAHNRLQKIYLESTRLVVACICGRYNEKSWTQDEWRAIQAFERKLRRSDSGGSDIEQMRFLPIRFGDGEVDGIFETTIVPDVRDRPAEDTARLILERLRLTRREAPLEKMQKPAMESHGTPGENPELTSAELARLRILSLGLTYNPATFVEAAHNGDVTVVQLFLRAGMQPDVSAADHTALQRAAQRGHLACALLLVQAGASVRKPLLDAARVGRREIVELLLGNNPDRDMIGAALGFAAGGGHVELVRRFLGLGADVNYECGGTALMGAAYSGQAAVVKLLLTEGSDLHAVSSRENETALHYATRSVRPSIEIVRALIEAGADVNARARDGRTPLMNAIRHTELVLLLLEHHADATAHTDDHITVLMMAAADDWDRPLLIDLLISQGAEVNARSECGDSALLWACGTIDNVSRPKIVRTLLAKGAALDSVDRNGWTATMLAAKNGNTEVLYQLIERGADLTAKNRDGKTALAIAVEAGRQEAAHMVREVLAHRCSPS